MIPVLPPAPTERLATRFWRGVRHPLRYLQDVTGGNPVYPLLVLFGLNAVDELDRTAFGVLIPNIQEAFDLDLSGILTVVAVVFGVALALQVPVAHFADRSNRIRLAIAGSLTMAVFSFGTGLATAVWMLYIARAGSALGRTTIDPTHNSLLADYYPPEQRPRVYSFHRAANTLGQFLGPLIGGVVAFYFGWQAPFFLFAIPIVILVVLALKLPEPIRGAHERRLMGSSEEVIATEEPPPSFAEGWRMVRKVQTLRRIFYALPFLAAALIGFATLGALKYQELGLNEAERGFVAAAAEPFAFLGLYLGARIGTRLIQKDPGEVIRFISVVAFVASGFAAMFALAPNVAVAVVANIGISIVLAILAPGVFASLSLAIPPRARSLGFSMGSLWVLPGVIVFPIVGVVGDAFGISWGMLLMTPVFVIGGLIISSASRYMKGDIAQVWGAAAARSEVLYDRREGRSKLLLVRKLNVSYGPVQILFDVDFEVDEGEIIALLGTNGAGKSTLLKAIGGVVQAERGTVILDGRDVTHMPPNEVAAQGIAQVPGGQGVFPTLSVAENLRVAGWLDRRDPALRDARIGEVLELFPVLRDRLDDPAGNLSGGQQQMLALGMAFLSRPKLLCIDELSLGLAPVVVEQLLGIVRAMRDQGTTVILVEQSVNVALTVAETAYFMEKGEIRFHGPTAELLERPDVLRSVYLEGAGKGLGLAAVSGNGSGNGSGPGSGNGSGSAPTASEGVTVPGVRPPSELIRRDEVPGLELHGLSVSFGGIRAVNDVSFSVPMGEILGIIGPNGAGKTTLFDLVSGFTRAESGRVLLCGEDVTADGPARRAWLGLGRSFQDARLFPALTVEETIKVAFDRWVDVRDPFNAALRLPAEFDSEVEVAGWTDELIELLGIGDFRSKFVRELSTGSRRVVDLACVMAHRPSVVLLDEPSSGIAQREAEALAPLLLRLRESLGCSVLLIEHDMPLVTSVADRMLALDQGTVVVEGTSEEVLNDPHVVASYLGSTDEVIARSGAR